MENLLEYAFALIIKPNNIITHIENHVSMTFQKYIEKLNQPYKEEPYDLKKYTLYLTSDKLLDNYSLLQIFHNFFIGIMLYFETEEKLEESDKLVDFLTIKALIEAQQEFYTEGLEVHYPLIVEATKIISSNFKK